LWRGKRCRYRLPACWDRPVAAAAGDEGLPDVWLALVRLCARHGIDAVDFLRWQMRPVTLLDGVPQPNQLASQPRIQRYLDAFPAEKQSVLVSFNSQQTHARGFLAYWRDMPEVNRQQALAATITTKAIDLTPLFRYCLACSIPGDYFRKIAESQEVAAAVQYAGNRRAYDATGWSAFIPPQLRMKADRIYSALIGWKPSQAGRPSKPRD
jgi:hypothetical protein